MKNKDGGGANQKFVAYPQDDVPAAGHSKVIVIEPEAQTEFRLTTSTATHKIN